jgi:hypothetical protein
MITVTVTDAHGKVLGIMRDVARPQRWYRVAAAAEWIANARDFDVLNDATRRLIPPILLDHPNEREANAS